MDFKPVKLSEKTIERLTAFAGNRSVSPNKLINEILDGIDSGSLSFVKKIKRIEGAPNCGFACGFKKNCLNYYNNECPILRRYGSDYEPVKQKVLIEFYRKKKFNPVKVKVKEAIKKVNKKFKGITTESGGALIE